MPCGQLPGSDDDGQEPPLSPLMPADQAWIDDCFLYHAPGAEQNDGIFEVNAAAREFAEVIFRNVPGSADRSAALRALREAKMWANSAIVLKGRR